MTDSGQVIKDVLRKRGLKQTWLAKKLQISPAMLSMMLKKDLKFCEVINICNKIKIPITIIASECEKKDNGHPTTNEPLSPNEI